MSQHGFTIYGFEEKKVTTVFGVRSIVKTYKKWESRDYSDFAPVVPLIIYRFLFILSAGRKE